MKRSPALIVGVSGLALAAIVLIAAPASADPADANNVYVNKADIGVEGASYPAGWFAGALDGGKTTDSVDSTAYGLTVRGDYQLLNGSPGTGALVPSIVSDTTVLVSQGAVSFQIPIFNDPANLAARQFSTLRTADAIQPGSTTIPTGAWISSAALDDGAGHTVAANTPVAYADILAALKPGYQVLAYGVFAPRTAAAPDSAPASIASITYDDVTNWFTPPPTGSASSAGATASALGSTGVTITAAGFLPGETVEVFYGTDRWANLDGTATADATGAISYLLKPADPTSAIGASHAGARGQTSTQRIFLPFVVTADPPASTSGSTLAATGVDTTVGMSVAALSLIGGALLMLLRRRLIVRRQG